MSPRDKNENDTTTTMDHRIPPNLMVTKSGPLPPFWGDNILSAHKYLDTKRYPRQGILKTLYLKGATHC